MAIFTTLAFISAGVEIMWMIWMELFILFVIFFTIQGEGVIGLHVKTSK